MKSYALNPKIIFFHRSQLHFRFHISFAKELTKYCDVSWLCLDQGKPIIEIPNVSHIFLESKKYKFLNFLNYIYSIIRILIGNQYDLYYVKNFPLCFILPLFFPKRKLILQLATPSVKDRKFVRILENIFLIKLNTLFYKSIIVGTEHMVSRFNLPDSKTYKSSYGFDQLSTVNKKFDHISLLYIGTLNNRELEKTIYGFSKFYQEYCEKIKIKYDIIGSGNEKFVGRVIRAIQDTGLNDVIKYHGWMDDEQVIPFFDCCNLGVTFVPITDFYDIALVTKNFEYILSGIPVIATNTTKNKQYVNSDNGILVDDNESAFYDGLVRFYDVRNEFDSANIRETCSFFAWEKAGKRFQVILETIMQK